MDLKDEQWAVIEPLLPRLPRRSDGRGRGLGKKQEPCSTASYGYYVQEHRGMTCRTDIHHTKRATDDSSNGLKMAQWRKYCGRWQKICESAVIWI